MSDYDLNDWNDETLPIKNKDRKKFKYKDPVQEAYNSGQPNPFKKGSKDWYRFEAMDNN